MSLPLSPQDDRPSFTAHNIRLDDGRVTRPEQDWLTAEDEWCRAATRLLRVLFPGGGEGRRIVDLGCLEGGFTVEFARAGFDALGIEVRESNFANCEFVRSHLSLPNLRFVRDDAWNIAAHGPFDVVFCCGLLYHIETPVAFLRKLAREARVALILNTHFATDELPDAYTLSPLTTNEDVPGRWFAEYDRNDIKTEADLDRLRWASWSNDRAFWIKREYLFDILRESGFDVVFEQMDCISGKVADAINGGYYKTHARGMFVGVRSEAV